MNTLRHCRFYGILDTAYVAPNEWLSKYQALAAGGAGIIQLRSKESSRVDYQALVERILELRATLQTKAHAEPFLVVNDDLDLCLEHPNLGLHLEHNPATPQSVREKLGAHRLLGISATDEAEVDHAVSLGPSVLSYFSVGSIFPSQTKPEAPAVGLELASYAVRSSPKLPLFCIGGINRTNIPQLRRAGASRVATVADVLRDPDTEAAVRQTIELLGS